LSLKWYFWSRVISHVACSAQWNNVKMFFNKQILNIFNT
jgi:hypothetical protein